MLQCNIAFETLPEDSFWHSTTVTVLQYLVMLVVAVTAFMSNFAKRKDLSSLYLCIAVVGLIGYCIMAYERQSAESIFAVFPLLAVGITPILGNYLDNKGKGATMLIFGSLLLIICHLTFAFVLPQFKGNNVGGVIVAFATILVLGASFSLVPAALWPSVPKLVDSKVIGSAYALIFWIQNIGLWLFPLLIGKILTATNQDIAKAVADGTMRPEDASVPPKAGSTAFFMPIERGAGMWPKSFRSPFGAGRTKLPPPSHQSWISPEKSNFDTVMVRS